MKQDFEQKTGIEGESLSIEVTTHCNGACKHCFVRAGISKRSSLSIDVVKKIIAEGYATAYRHLHLTGGEPLLWEGLLEVLDYAFDLGVETIFLNTNGTLLEKDVNCRLAAYDGLSVSVSLDGPQALHDHIRGEGSYRRTIECIEKAVDAGVDLFIFTTASKSLIQDLLVRFK
jgi:MoaA/NifB/PqqE/SkfB family radical SAM enzyme